jgi:surfactin family lipopeptide synthetase C
LTGTKPANIEDIYELSPLQEGMLFHSLYEPQAGLYVQQLSFPLPADLNVFAYEKAWQQLVDRYAVLRTSFHWEDLSRPLQVVHRHFKFCLNREDWRQLSSAGQTGRMYDFLKRERDRGFPLSKLPLTRLTLIQLPDQTYRAMWTFHHILIDGWSVQTLFKDLESLYNAACSNEEIQLEPIYPYKDYIVWLQRQDLAAAERFWRKTLDGFSAPTPLRVDEPMSPSGEDEGEYGVHEAVLSDSTTSALENLARQHRLTLNTIVQGAWALLLSRYSGERDVIFGGVVSGRPAELTGVESMVGLFINALPVRTQVEPDKLLLPWLKGLQDQQLKAREYEYTPMLQIQRWSHLPPGMALFESIVAFENFPTMFGAEPDNPDPDEPPYFERTNYPLCLVVMPQPRLRFYFYYQRRRFRAGIIARMAQQCQNILTEIATDTDRRMTQISTLRPGELHQQLVGWNQTQLDSPELDSSLAGLFARQVAHRAEGAAFHCGSETLTYADLDRKSNRLAHILRARGVGREKVVGVCLDPSLQVPLALLAIWKAGGAYLPLDPALPAERLSHMARQANITVVVTIGANRALLDGVFPAVLLDDDAEEIERAPATVPPGTADPGDLAYVLFTSGSTGQPKGVAVEHRQVLNRLAWMWRVYPFQAGEVCCLKTALGFVDSLWELLGGLLAGVPCVIIPRQEAQDPFLLIERLSEHGVTRLWLVPSLLSALLDTHRDLERRLPRLWFWVSSGEPLGVELWRRFYRSLPNSVLYNLYGTSEVWDATWYEPSAEAASSYLSSHVPIGRPVDNVTAYVLDRNLEPVPVGAPGELYIGGLGLARGYVGCPDLTAERFVPHAFSQQPGLRLYRTGDLARYRDDGTLEHLARIDEQVKIRGFRIEPAEIEVMLEAHPAVQRAAVAAKPGPNGEVRLVAYVVRRGDAGAELGEEPAQVLRRHMSARIPEYMTPSAYVFLDALPLTRSGKIDRRNLPVPGKNDFLSTGPFTAAQGATEERIARIWSEILGLEPIGRNDDFFELGGHSLLATRFVSRVRDAFKVELPLRAIFEQPTVAGIAEVVAAAASDASRKVSPSIVPLARDRYRVNLTPDGAPDLPHG